MSNDNEKIDILHREEFIERVVTIVNKIAENKGNMTFAINGEWGCGKTFVLKEIEDRLEKDENKKFLVIRYNCWQYDYYEEPLAAIVSSLLDFKDDGNKKNIVSENTKKELKEIMLNVGLGIATSVIKNKLGIDLGDFQVGIFKARDEIKNFDKHHNFKESLKDLNKVLKDISKNCTIVFAVDELDRCLPEYAIKVLERLHHIADGVSNMITIIAFDKERLKNTIGSIFGLENVDKYLKKFIKFEMYLDNGKLDHSKFLEKFSDFCSRFDNNSLWKLDSDKEKRFIEEFLFKGVDIRLQEEIVEEAMTFHDLRFKNEEKKPDYTVMYMELLIVTESCTNIRYNFQNLSDELKSDNILDVISVYRFWLKQDSIDANRLSYYFDFGKNITKLDEFRKILPTKHDSQIGIQEQISLPTQPVIRKCIKCGALLLDDSLYCYSCGKERKKCSCGEFIDAAMNFCPKCGKTLAKTERQKQQEEQKRQEKINKLAIEYGFTDLPYNFVDKGDYIEVIPPLGNIHMIKKTCENQKITWKNANNLAKSLKTGGFHDWRIPTLYELEIIYKFKDFCGIKTEVNNSWYLSSSDAIFKLDDKTYAGAYNYTSGEPGFVVKSDERKDYVLFIRG